MLYIYIIGLILFFILLRKDSSNPLWFDIILSLFYPILILIIILGFIGILIYNIIFELKN